MVQRRLERLGWKKTKSKKERGEGEGWARE